MFSPFYVRTVTSSLSRLKPGLPNSGGSRIVNWKLAPFTRSTLAEPVIQPLQFRLKYSDVIR